MSDEIKNFLAFVGFFIAFGLIYYWQFKDGLKEAEEIEKKMEKEKK